MTRTDRHLDVIRFTGNSGGSMTGTLPVAVNRYLYNDLTSAVTGYALPGETLTPAMTYTGSWMHGYVYLDYGNDGVFDFLLNENGTPASNSDVASYSYSMEKTAQGLLFPIKIRVLTHRYLQSLQVLHRVYIASVTKWTGITLMQAVMLLLPTISFQTVVV